MFSKMHEIESRYMELDALLALYDSGDKISNAKYSSSEIQALEEEKDQLSHTIWRYRELKNCGLCPRYLSASIDDVTKKNTIVKEVDCVSLYCGSSPKISNIDAVALFSSYASDPSIFYSGRSLVFSGPTGVGKTHIATAIAMAVKERQKRKSVHFIAMSDLIAMFLDKSYSAEQRISILRDKHFLVVDDMSSEKSWDSIIEAVVQRIFRHRYSSNLPTLITTNLEPRDFVNKYGERAKSVFCGNTYNLFVFLGNNIRLERSISE